MLGTTFILAFRSIRRHLMRSFLTTLGIIIGVAAVVTMVTLGQATTLAVQKQIASLGNNILMVRPGQGFGRGGGGPQPPNFDAQDVAAVRDQIAGITAVAPQASSPVTAVYEGSNWTTTVNGTTSGFFQIQPWPLVAGRGFEPDEEQAGKAVCIIGNTVRKNLFTQGSSPSAPPMPCATPGCTRPNSSVPAPPRSWRGCATSSWPRSATSCARRSPRSSAMANCCRHVGKG